MPAVLWHCVPLITVVLWALELARGHDLYPSVTCSSYAHAAYLVVADQETGRSLPFGYLERIKEEFQSKYGDKAQTAGAHSLNKAFGYAIYCAVR